MKKILTGVLATIMVLSVGTTSAFAAGPGSGQGRNFVDEDGNGICDFAGEFCRYVDENYDGICDYCGIEQNGYGCHFVDADGDGICDNYRGQGLGLGRGFRGGRGR